jgi:hypothetical protein
VTDPKVHHYVPKFYLKNFSTENSRLWVWDKHTDHVFASSARNLACETDFYLLDDKYWLGNFDPLEMEKQFSEVESLAAEILSGLIASVRQMQHGERFQLSAVERKHLCLYLALQFLRTADTRDTLWLSNFEKPPAEKNSDERRALHLHLLWDEELLNSFTRYFASGTWTIAKNSTGEPLMTSDNPVCFRAADNSMWLKAGMLSKGTYLTFPIAHDLILYVYPEGEKTFALRKFSDCVSPVTLTPAMISDENTGQAFMASRFLISASPNFSDVRKFSKTIGTDTFRR